MATQLKLETTDGGTGTPIPGEGEGIEAGSQSPRDFDTEARNLGWRPKDEFPGNPAQWVDAETFIVRGETMTPFIKKENARLKRELDSIKKDLRRATTHFEGAEKRAFDRAKSELETRIEAAIEVGDLEAGRAALKEMDELKPIADAPAGKHSLEEAQEAYDDFRDAHPWYDKANLASATETEQSARIYADRMTEKLTRGVPADQLPPPTELFAQIADAVYEKYPALKNGKAPRQKPASAVEGGGQGRGRGGVKSWDGLPDDARRQYQRFIDRGILGVKATGDKTADLEAAKKYYARNHAWEG